MNDKYSTTEGKTSEKLSDEAMLSAQWKNIDWHKAEREVNRLQIRIVKATQQKDYNAVKRLQYLLTHSFYAKALAVKRVVTNDGRRTPGVDGVLWNTPAKKMAAALCSLCRIKCGGVSRQTAAAASPPGIIWMRCTSS